MNATFKFDSLAKSKIHLGVCGSVAAYKSLDLMRSLQKLDMSVSATLTESAQKFISLLSFSSLGASPVYGTLFDSIDPFEHLEPGTFADSFSIVPASANTMAKLAMGMANDMLSAQALSYPRPLLIFPAMNPRMWESSATQNNVSTLLNLGHSVVTPCEGDVACGDFGVGKLPELSSILFSILRDCAKAKGLDSLAGKKVLVTLGPTREQWDDVRVWTNLSTGLMGASIACAAWIRGAEVHAIAGPDTPSLPLGSHIYPCMSAKQMLDAAQSLWSQMDMGFFTAAVADYSPLPYRDGKYKKQKSEELSITFAPNTDILATLGASKASHQKILGFAAESSNLEMNTQQKLTRKNADIMVGNLITPAASTFGSANNVAYLYRSTGKEEYLPLMTKANLAWRLIDELCDI